jgi:hypothetical protein
MVYWVGSKTGAFITVVSALVALVVALATIQSTQASIDFWIQKPDTLVPGLNHITVYCKNGGGMDGDFYLVIKLGNATFSKQTELPYTSVDESTVKIKFILHKEDASEKTIYFTVNQTEDASISVSLEKASLIEFIKANALYPTQLEYQWDPQSHFFNCTDSQ